MKEIDDDNVLECGIIMKNFYIIATVIIVLQICI